jgi:hypothetical protein
MDSNPLVSTISCIERQGIDVLPFLLLSLCKWIGWISLLLCMHESKRTFVLISAFYLFPFLLLEKMEASFALSYNFTSTSIPREN